MLATLRRASKGASTARRGSQEPTSTRKGKTIIQSQLTSKVPETISATSEGSIVKEPFEIPDSNSGDIGGDLISSDDDGFQEPISLTPKMRKSRAKPLAPRVQFGENKLLVGEQM